MAKKQHLVTYDMLSYAKAARGGQSLPGGSVADETLAIAKSIAAQLFKKNYGWVKAEDGIDWNFRSRGKTFDVKAILVDGKPGDNDMLMLPGHKVQKCDYVVVYAIRKDLGLAWEIGYIETRRLYEKAYFRPVGSMLMDGSKSKVSTYNFNIKELIGIRLTENLETNRCHIVVWSTKEQCKRRGAVDQMVDGKMRRLCGVHARDLVWMKKRSDVEFVE